MSPSIPSVCLSCTEDTVRLFLAAHTAYPLDLVQIQDRLLIRIERRILERNARFQIVVPGRDLARRRVDAVHLHRRTPDRIGVVHHTGGGVDRQCPQITRVEFQVEESAVLDRLLPQGGRVERHRTHRHRAIGEGSKRFGEGLGQQHRIIGLQELPTSVDRCMQHVIDLGQALIEGIRPGERRGVGRRQVAELHRTHQTEADRVGLHVLMHEFTVGRQRTRRCPVLIALRRRHTIEQTRMQIALVVVHGDVGERRRVGVPEHPAIEGRRARIRTAAAVVIGPVEVPVPGSVREQQGEVVLALTFRGCQYRTGRIARIAVRAAAERIA